MKHPFRLLGAGFAVFAVIVLVAALSGPSVGAPAPASPPAVSGTYGHDQLQSDADMTQQMSTPNANGPMQSGQIQEPMLQRSQDPAYVRALEQHQADIDRMLGRGAP